jgi:5,10-methylenetetrahydromethanopterin reductase
MPLRRFAFSPHLPIEPLEDAIKVARMAEAAGFESMCWGEGPSDVDPFQVLSVLSTQTQKMRLGTGIASWSRTPVNMAAAAATLDQISGGRAWLGLGTMPKDWNRRWHGIDAARMVLRMREYIDAIRMVWTSHAQPVSYSGSIFSVENYKRRTGAPQGQIPIYLAATMPQMIRLAGEIADGVILHNIHTLPYLHEVALPALAQGAERAGRSIEQLDVMQSVLCSVSPDRREALHWAKVAIGSHLVHPYVQAAFDVAGFAKERDLAIERVVAGDTEGAADVMPDEMASVVAVAGTPDDCRQQIQRYADTANVALLTGVTQNVPPGFHRENVTRMLETFALS